MKKIIYNCGSKWNKNIVTFALEHGITEFIAEKDVIARIRELAKVKIISADKSADLIIGKDIDYIVVVDKKAEESVVQTAKNRPVIVKLDNWKIIPIENIIAQTDNIIVEINNFEDLKLCSGILEKGVSSFVIHTEDLNELKEMVDYINNTESKIELVDAEILDVLQLPVTDRVCIDSCNMMKTGEGFLIGSSSQCLFLVHSESIENPYVAARPFRVNAGAVHSYILLPENKTRYLSELNAGDPLLTVGANGNTQLNVVGRIKLEKRPMLLIKAVYQKREFSVVLQNAETVNLTSSEGAPISVARVKKGDKIKCYIENTGRHFGMSIVETITEK